MRKEMGFRTSILDEGVERFNVRAGNRKATAMENQGSRMARESAVSWKPREETRQEQDQLSLRKMDTES
jgi:hypothetical protein